MNSTLTISDNTSEFYEGCLVVCEPSEQIDYMILKAEGSTLTIYRVFKIIGHFDIKGKNPLIWFLGRML